MRLWLGSISLLLFIFMSTSFALCLISGIAMAMQMGCLHSGASVCSMNGEECCLTESVSSSVRTVNRAPKSVSGGQGHGNLQMPEESS